jgi:hypothetical protein
VIRRAVPKKAERPDWRDAAVGIRGLSETGGAACPLAKTSNVFEEDCADLLHISLPPAPHLLSPFRSVIPNLFRHVYWHSCNIDVRFGTLQCSQTIAFHPPSGNRLIINRHDDRSLPPLGRSPPPRLPERVSLLLRLVCLESLPSSLETLRISMLITLASS